MKLKYTLPPLLVSEYSRRLEMLTTVSRVTTLGFLSWSQVLLDARWPTIRRRGIGAGPWTFLNSSTTSHSAFFPVWPIRVSARYRWEEIVKKKKRKRMVCYWLIVNCRLMLQTAILTTIVWVTFLGFFGGSQVLLDAGWSTARRRGIGTGPWAFLNSSTTRHATFSPFRPANVTTRHR